MQGAIKILGIGLSKTGTSTLKACMRHWGFKHAGCKREAFKLWRHNRHQKLLDWMNQYESFENWPWPLFYKQIDRAFPGSRFILTRRASPGVWFDSFCRHADRNGPSGISLHTYGYRLPHEHRNVLIPFYEEHITAVRRYFRQRPDDLLEVCWEEGVGWDKLAGFLELERPDIPFPHANKAPMDSQARIT